VKRRPQGARGPIQASRRRAFESRISAANLDATERARRKLNTYLDTKAIRLGVFTLPAFAQKRLERDLERVGGCFGRREVQADGAVEALDSTEFVADRDRGQIDGLDSLTGDLEHQRVGAVYTGRKRRGASAGPEGRVNDSPTLNAALGDPLDPGARGRTRPTVRAEGKLDES